MDPLQSPAMTESLILSTTHIFSDTISFTAAFLIAMQSTQLSNVKARILHKHFYVLTRDLPGNVLVLCYYFTSKTL